MNISNGLQRAQCRRDAAFILVFCAFALLASCANQPTPSAFEPPGFFMGLVHGFFIVFSLIGSIFTEHRIYAFPNSGGWYDFGYVLGAASFLGAGGAGAR